MMQVSGLPCFSIRTLTYVALRVPRTVLAKVDRAVIPVDRFYEMSAGRTAEATVHRSRPVSRVFNHVSDSSDMIFSKIQVITAVSPVDVLDDLLIG
jgi:hypothetical protein